MSAEDADLRTVKRLIERLESEDAFERRQAIESLALLTQQRLDFSWRAPAEERSASIVRWRKWLAREEKKRKSGGIKSALDLLQSMEIPAGEMGNVQKALEQAFKNLPESHKKAFIHQMLAKVASVTSPSSEHERCERCRKRPATVKITERAKTGAYEQATLCEVCAGKAGI